YLSCLASNAFPHCLHCKLSKSIRSKSAVKCLWPQCGHVQVGTGSRHVRDFRGITLEVSNLAQTASLGSVEWQPLPAQRLLAGNCLRYPTLNSHSIHRLISMCSRKVRSASQRRFHYCATVLINPSLCFPIGVGLATV